MWELKGGVGCWRDRAEPGMSAPSVAPNCNLLCLDRNAANEREHSSSVGDEVFSLRGTS